MSKTLREEMLLLHGPVLGPIVLTSFMAEKKASAERQLMIETELAELRRKKWAIQLSQVNFLQDAAVQVQAAYEVWAAMAASLERLHAIASSESGQFDPRIAELTAELLAERSWIKQPVEPWRKMPEGEYQHLHESPPLGPPFPAEEVAATFSATNWGN